uniref:RIP metalloprotease n=1 Tax=candidate division WWE3 bacterium TaxID=2053526 RepID=A0A7C4TKX6_UNCKA
MLTLFVLIVILSILVLVHEFGHFYAARRNNVRVEEFGWGIPPRIWGKKIGETIYSINWLPFGGFVKLMGEDLEEGTSPEASKNLDKTVSDERSFRSKTPLQRIVILLAGVFMNVILAVALYFVMFLITNFHTMTLPLFFDYRFKFGQVDRINTVVGAFSPDSVAKTAGIEVGDAILEVDGVPVYSSDDIRRELASKDGKEVRVLTMDIKKTDRPVEALKVSVKANEGGNVLLGVLLTPAFRINYGGSQVQKLTSGFSHTYNMAAYSLHTLGGLFRLAIEERNVAPVSESVSSPVGVSRVISSILTYSGKEILVGLIDLTALLSVSLAIMNVLPFPALDGGRFFFVLVELIRGKKISDKVEGYVHRWGMLFLLALLVLITVKDIRSFF